MQCVWRTMETASTRSAKHGGYDEAEWFKQLQNVLV